MKITDFAVTTDAEGQMFVYNVKDDSTKNHQDDASKVEGRMWEMRGNLFVVNHDNIIVHCFGARIDTDKMQ